MFFLPTSVAAVQIFELTPQSGPVGTSVRLSGAGFDPALISDASIGSVSCPITAKDASGVTVVIPSGAATGRISVTQDGVQWSHYFPFTVTRTLPGAWRLPAGLSKVGYAVGSRFGAATPAVDGSFTAVVADSGVTLVGAAGGETSPVFIAAVVPTDTDVVLDSVSTARTLIFLATWIFTQDADQARDILAAIAALPETMALANRISAVAATGEDFLEDPVVLSNLKAGIEAYLADPVVRQPTARLPTAFLEGTPENTRMRYITPPADADLPDRWLENTLTGPTDAYGDFYTLNVEGKEGTPLDWSCLLYKLDPAQFPQGLASLDQWTWRTRLNRLEDREIDKIRVGAKLYSRYGDIVDLLLGKVLSADAGGLSVPASTPGVYVTRAYSGNLKYGAQWYWSDWNIYQAAFIYGLPYGTREWNVALYGNMSVAVLDAISVIVSIKDLLQGDNFGDLLFSITYEVEKAIAMIGQGDTAPKEAEYEEIFYAALRGALKTLWGQISEMSMKAIVSGVGKALLKSVDIAGKVSNVGQAAERMSGLWGGRVLALESSLIVVGKPFEPTIKSFAPIRGMPGSVVVIEGYNFNPAKNEDGSYKTRVFFGKDSTDPENPTVKYEAKVLYATEQTLTVNVPAGTQTGPIYVQTDTGFTGTYTLRWPYTVFTVIGPLDDVTLTVDPDPVAVGTLMRITGSGFPPGAGFVAPMIDGDADDGNAIPERAAPYGDTKVIFDGYSASPVTVQNLSSTEILVRAPTVAGTHGVQVKQGSSVSKTGSFTVFDPTTKQAGSDGAAIYVSTQADGNARDDQISLREAMMIANGQLAIGSLTHCTEDDPPECHREREKVNGDVAGAAYRDSIEIYSNLQGTTFPVGSPLPPASNWDVYNLGGIVVDGGGMAGNAWTVGGAGYTTLEYVTLKNFGAGIAVAGGTGNVVGHVTLENISGTGIVLSDGATGNRFSYPTLKALSGHGVHLSGGAKFNRVETAVIEGCGGTGIFFDQSATGNSINDTKVTGTGANLHGLHLTGAGVYYNDVSIPGSSSTALPAWYNGHGGYGVLIENGAHHNTVHPGAVKNNGAGGIRIEGAGSDYNIIGRISDVVPRRCEVHFNGGPGVYLGPGVDHTIIRYISVAGNAGDGVLLEGPDCSHNQIQSCATGVDLYAETMVQARNEGSGFRLTGGAHHNLIGGRYPGSSGWRNAICGNRDQGVLIEGPASAYNVVNQSHFGSMQPVRYVWPPVYFPNGVNGIVLAGGAHHNIIGDRHKWLDNHILAHEAGAGILIEGEGTDNNLLLGNQIGVQHMEPPGTPNGVGIHLKNGPRGNVIGRMGDHVPESIAQPDDSEILLTFLPGNVISNSSQAGMVLENCGAQIDAEGRAAGANVILNNDIGCREDRASAAGNTNGIRILSGARGNVVGGPLKGQANRIHYNRRSGIELYGNVTTDPRLANRISGNSIYGTGYDQGAWTLSHLDGFDHGIGILVHGRSSGATVGVASEDANRIESGMVGVYIDDSENISVVNNHIEGNVFNNAIAGVIVRGSTDCAVGGTGAHDGNRIRSTGSGAENAGGIVISGGAGHTITQNLIGTDGRTVDGVSGWGIAIVGASDNRIGPGPGAGGNVIVKAGLGGIRLTGPQATGSRIQGNWIGTDARGTAGAGNAGPGIQIDGGASNNLVGGGYGAMLQKTVVNIPAPNVITGNAGAGVAVNDASPGNAILYNSITANAGKGIDLGGGGNAAIAAPMISTVSDAFVSGSVDIGSVPAGSTIQVFSDSGGEGNQYLGQTEVRTGGAWFLNIARPVFPGLTATATSAGNTSEFSTVFGTPAGGLLVARTDGGSGAETTPLPRRSGAVVLDLTVTASGEDVEVAEIAFDASGSMDDATEIKGFWLYLDADNDGKLGPVDRRLSAATGQVFTADDGRMAFRIEDGFIDAGATQRWLLAADFADTVSWGEGFQVRILSAAAVTATAVLPYAAVTPTGAFPLASDLFEIAPSLVDAVRVLQMLCGINTVGLGGVGDIDDDEKIGMSEAVYILQSVAGLR
jgi:hypothetical protein